jgi:hypothetical protein
MAQITPDLSQLHDIHLPTPVSPWAFAPGWYLLGVVLFGMLCVMVRKTYQLHAQKRRKQDILHMLSSLKTEQDRVPNSQKTCAAVSELLRRVALMCFEREQVAGLQGDAWLAFLNQTRPDARKEDTPLDFTLLQKALNEYPFQPPIAQEQAKPQIEMLFHAAKKWIQNQVLPISQTYTLPPTGGQHV